ncbi:hypothetical protein NCCP1664_24740 [Zafaria cholistanensis]|uniref:Uncharacterized protein n=1 Tax=Zafaria cholistanensis TaxID=1682741 RepID=A0A5A7NTB3_9MICC|nr:hypothetical protein [Zafaria cholistanensis]GER23979.1 hypothetical protein NCCP1664_24740 [Zafaria cholistanensis]
MTDFLNPALLDATLRAAEQWRTLFAELGTFAGGVTFSRDPSAFGGEGADIARIVVNGVAIEAAEWASDDIRFSAGFPDGRSVYGGETFFEETDGRGGLFGLRRVQEPDVEARSAFNALMVLATMKAIADAVTEKSWDEIRGSGGIDTPTGRLSGFDEP